MAFSHDMTSAAHSLGAQLGELIDAHCFEADLGRVWAALYVAGGDLDASGLSELMREEPELIESSLEELEELGAVRVDEGRYGAEEDPLRIAVRFIKKRELDFLAELEDASLFARDRLKKNRASQEQEAAQRVAKLAKNISLVKTLLKALSLNDSLDLDALVKAISSTSK